MKLPLVDLLYAAINSPHGVAVETNDRERLRQKLYPERKRDPAFANLHFTLPAHTNQLWIINGKGSTEGDTKSP